ncbi:MAG: hypothetical protein ACD_41C00173G0004 [uncultured bacterium]|nr:MAG: hypothetical protein ACD_41C00173G0004 [uncultured bacterium]HBY74280.1 hypothetical protein [Candidatus Kerfeldbacteria bacterium]
MGLFDKVKRSLNIGGAKLAVTPKQTALTNGSKVDVDVVLTGGKMEQPVKSVHVKLMQKDTWTQRSVNGPSRQNWQQYTLAEQSDTTAFSLKPGEQKSYHFSVPVQAQLEQLSKQGGVLGALGKLNAMTQQRRQEWWFEAVADIEGSMDTKATAAVTVQQS